MAIRLLAVFVLFSFLLTTAPRARCQETTKQKIEDSKAEKEAPKGSGLVIKAAKDKPQSVKVERNGKVVSGMLIYLNSRGLRMKIRGRSGPVAVNYRPAQITWVEIDSKKYVWNADEKTFELSGDPAKAGITP